MYLFQMGKGRTTTGMILACLLKDILFGDTTKKYYNPSDKVTTEEFPDEDEYLEEVCVILNSVGYIKLLNIYYILQRAKRGQYQVLDDISKYIPGVDEGKAHIDHIINLCGEKPEGT